MYDMERFATQIYHTEKGGFKGNDRAQQLDEASKNESTHVQKLRAEILKLNGRVYPLGGLFQFMGWVMGEVARLSGKRNLFRMDGMVERRAVKDYSGFIKSISFPEDTVKTIRGIIADEEQHIINWQRAADSLKAVKEAKPGTRG